MTRPSRAARDAAALAGMLGLEEWQVKRAVRDGLLPIKDRSAGWSTDLADQLAARYRRKQSLAALRRRIGTVPDMSTWDLSRHWSGWSGLDDGPGLRDAVRELEYLKILRVLHWYKGHPTFDGRSIEAVTDPAVVQAAAVTGRTLTADEAADRLQVRRVDFDHMHRAGLIVPRRSVPTGYGSKSRDPGMWLYRAAAVDDLAAADTIGGVPWEQLRALEPRQRSPLAKLPTHTPTRKG